MGASAIDSIERALHIKESNLLVTNLDHLPLTGNNLISLRYLHKTYHNSPPIKFLLETPKPSFYPPNIFLAWHTWSHKKGSAVGFQTVGFNLPSAAGRFFSFYPPFYEQNKKARLGRTSSGDDAESKM
jgi:hypothetical protein